MIRPDDHRRVVEAARKFCPRCQVPYGYGSCSHSNPFLIEDAAEELLERYGAVGARFKLLATVERIAAEVERKHRVRNARHALRYRAEARAASGGAGDTTDD